MKTRKATLDEMLRTAVDISIPEGTERIAVWASGGIDSSTLLYYLNHLDYEVEAIHVYFNERARSKLLFESVTEHLGIEGHSHLMTLKDHFQLLPRALFNHAGPMSAFPSMILFMTLASMKYDIVLHGLGLDELLGGYPQHARAQDRDFVKVENRFYDELPMRVYNTERQARAMGLRITAPFINEELREFCQALPREEKTSVGLTKIILRDLMTDRIPLENMVEGFIAGSKEGFHPPIREWWDQGLGSWVMSRLSHIDTIRLRKKSLWAKIIRANERERVKCISARL